MKSALSNTGPAKRLEGEKMKRFHDLTKCQEGVFVLILKGKDEMHNWRIYEALIKKGLIKRYQERIPGWPPCMIYRYKVLEVVKEEWRQWQKNKKPAGRERE